MNRLKSFFVVIFFIVAILGCDMKHCIKYHNDTYGDFEYCLDNTKSEIEKAPVLTDVEKDKSIVGVEMGFLDKIGDVLGDILKPNTLNYKENTYSNPLIPEARLEKINRLLDEFRGRDINNAKE